MDFALSDDQKQIQEMVRDFATSDIKPHLAEWDEAQHFPVDTFKKAGELGLLGVTIPEEYGGAGLSYVDYVNVIEELGVIDSGFAKEYFPGQRGWILSKRSLVSIDSPGLSSFQEV